MRNSRKAWSLVNSRHAANGRSLVEQLTGVDTSENSESDREFSRTVLRLRIAQTRAAIEWLAGFS